MSDTRPVEYAADELVVLRAFDDGDISDVATACQDPEIVRWTATIPSPYTEAHARWWIGQHEAWRREGRSYVFAIVGHGDERVGGSIAIESLLAPPAQTGYWVAPWARNRGYASHALRLVTRWAAQNLGVGRLELVTKVGNERSERVARNAGFEPVGEKSGYRPTNARDDSEHDIRCWAINTPIPGHGVSRR